MTVRVTIPQSIRCFCGGSTVVEARGETVADVLNDLGERYPDFSTRLLDDDGSPSRFIRIFVGEVEISALQGLDTPVSTDMSLHLLAGAAGG